MNYNADTSQRAISLEAQVDRRRHGAMRAFKTALGRAIMRSLGHDQEIKEVFPTGIQRLLIYHFRHDPHCYPTANLVYKYLHGFDLPL